MSDKYGKNTVTAIEDNTRRDQINFVLNHTALLNILSIHQPALSSLHISTDNSYSNKLELLFCMIEKGGDDLHFVFVANCDFFISSFMKLSNLIPLSYVDMIGSPNYITNLFLKVDHQTYVKKYMRQFSNLSGTEIYKIIKFCIDFGNTQDNLYYKWYHRCTVLSPHYGDHIQAFRVGTHTHNQDGKGYKIHQV